MVPKYGFETEAVREFAEEYLNKKSAGK